MKFEKENNPNPTNKYENPRKQNFNLNSNIRLHDKFDKNKNSSNNNTKKFLDNKVMGLKFDEIDFDKEENAIKEFVIINLNKLLYLRNKVKKFSKNSKSDFLISSLKEIVYIKNEINKNTINNNDNNKNNKKRISNNINNKRVTLNEKNFHTRQLSTLKTNPNYNFKISNGTDNFPKINNYLEGKEINENKINILEQNKFPFQLNESSNKYLNRSTNLEFLENQQNKSLEIKSVLRKNSIMNNKYPSEKLVISDNSNTLLSKNNKILSENNHLGTKLQNNEISQNFPRDSSELKTDKFFFNSERISKITPLNRNYSRSLNISKKQNLGSEKINLKNSAIIDKNTVNIAKKRSLNQSKSLAPNLYSFSINHEKTNLNLKTKKDSFIKVLKKTNLNKNNSEKNISSSKSFKNCQSLEKTLLNLIPLNESNSNKDGKSKLDNIFFENSSDFEVINMEYFRKLTLRDKVKDSLSENEDVEIQNEESFLGSFQFNINSNFLSYWDFLITLITLYTLTFSPYQMAFPDVTNNIIQIMECFMDLVFIFDIIFQFFIPFYNYEEDLIKSKIEIAKNYITGWFFIDLIASIPGSIMTYFMMKSYKEEDSLELSILITHSINQNSGSFGNINKITRLAKFYRVLKITKLSKILKMSGDTTKKKISSKIIPRENMGMSASVKRILNSLFIFLFASHMISCIWIFIGTSDYPNWLVKAKIADSDNFSIYISSLYFHWTTIFTIGYGDILSYNTTERLYNIFLMFVGVLIYSFAVSALGTIVTSYDISEEKFMKNIDNLYEMRVRYNLPNYFSDKVEKILRYDFKNNKTEKFLFINDLPIRIKNQLLLNMYKDVIRNFKFFKDKSIEFSTSVVFMMKPLRLFKNEYLFYEGEFVEEIVFVRKGFLTVNLGLKYNQAKIMEVSPNEHFGEIFLLSKTPSPVILKVGSKFADLIIIRSEDMFELYETYSDCINKIFSISKYNYDSMMKKIEKIKAKLKLDEEKLRYKETHFEDFLRSKKKKKFIAEKKNFNFIPEKDIEESNFNKNYNYNNNIQNTRTDSILHLGSEMKVRKFEEYKMLKINKELTKEENIQHTNKKLDKNIDNYEEKNIQLTAKKYNNFQNENLNNKNFENIFKEKLNEFTNLESVNPIKKLLKIRESKTNSMEIIKNSFDQKDIKEIDLFKFEEIDNNVINNNKKIELNYNNELRHFLSDLSYNSIQKMLSKKSLGQIRNPLPNNNLDDLKTNNLEKFTSRKENNMEKIKINDLLDVNKTLNSQKCSVSIKNNNIIDKENNKNKKFLNELDFSYSNLDADDQSNSIKKIQNNSHFDNLNSDLLNLQENKYSSTKNQVEKEKSPLKENNIVCNINKIYSTEMSDNNILKSKNFKNENENYHKIYIVNGNNNIKNNYCNNDLNREAINNLKKIQFNDLIHNFSQNLLQKQKSCGSSSSNSISKNLNANLNTFNTKKMNPEKEANAHINLKSISESENKNNITYSKNLMPFSPSENVNISNEEKLIEKKKIEDIRNSQKQLSLLNKNANNIIYIDNLNINNNCNHIYESSGIKCGEPFCSSNKSSSRLKNSKIENKHQFSNNIFNFKNKLKYKEDEIDEKFFRENGNNCPKKYEKNNFLLNHNSIYTNNINENLKVSCKNQDENINNLFKMENFTERETKSKNFSFNFENRVTKKFIENIKRKKSEKNNIREDEKICNKEITEEIFLKNSAANNLIEEESDKDTTLNYENKDISNNKNDLFFTCFPSENIQKFDKSSQIVNQVMNSEVNKTLIYSPSAKNNAIDKTNKKDIQFQEKNDSDEDLKMKNIEDKNIRNMKNYLARTDKKYFNKQTNDITSYEKKEKNSNKFGNNSVEVYDSKSKVNNHSNYNRISKNEKFFDFEEEMFKNCNMDSDKKLDSSNLKIKNLLFGDLSKNGLKTERNKKINLNKDENIIDDEYLKKSCRSYFEFSFPLKKVKFNNNLLLENNSKKKLNKRGVIRNHNLEKLKTFNENNFKKTFKEKGNFQNIYSDDKENPNDIFYNNSHSNYLKNFESPNSELKKYLLLGIEQEYKLQAEKINKIIIKILENNDKTDFFILDKAKKSILFKYFHVFNTNLLNKDIKRNNEIQDKTEKIRIPFVEI